jgi:acetylglutamate kinase
VQARLIAALLQGGIDALGLSGVDGGLLRARRLAHPIHDYGLVGEIIQVRTTLLLSLLEQGITPVLAPISLGPQGELLNVNADQVASAVAHALQAEQLDFVSNVPGVLDQGHLIPSLDPQTVADLKAKGVIEGGMLPKVDAALAALQAGVRRVRIVDLAGLPTEAGSTFLPQPKTPIQSGNKVTR